MSNRFRQFGTLIAFLIVAAILSWPCLADARLDALLQKAQAGDHQAEFVLGLAYEIGNGTDQDYSQAANWYGKAADAGYAPAVAGLGYLYQTGKGVPEDHAKAAQLYRRAAEAGDVRGQFFLALAYTNGIGVTQDAKEAAVWYHAAAKAGQQQSQLILGMMLQDGIGVRRNEFAARRWLDQAANGADETSEKAKRLREAIDSKVLASGPSGLKDIDALKMIGFGLAGLALAGAVLCDADEKCQEAAVRAYDSQEAIRALEEHQTQMARDLWINTLAFPDED